MYEDDGDDDDYFAVRMHHSIYLRLSRTRTTNWNRRRKTRKTLLLSPYPLQNLCPLQNPSSRSRRKIGQQNKKETPAPKTSNAKKAKPAPAKATPAVNEEKKPTSAKPANPYKKNIERNKLNHNRRVRSDKKRGLV